MFSDLAEIAAYFENRADAEYFPDSARPVPNEAMRMMGMVKDVQIAAMKMVKALSEAAEIIEENTMYDATELHAFIAAAKGA